MSLKSIFAVFLSLTILTTMVNGKSRLISNLESGEKQTLVTYGTSLTHKGGWVGELEKELKDQFPNQCTFINSGQSGKNSIWGLENLERRVLQHKPDTVFIEFSMNDAVERFDISVEQARKNLETMIDRIMESNRDCEVILMTMTIGDKYPEGHKSHRKDIELYYEAYRAIANERRLLLIDHYPNWKALKSEDPKLYKQYVPDTIHANAEGYTNVVIPVIFGKIGLSVE